MKELDTLLKKLIRTGTGRVRFYMAVMGMSVAIFLILAAVQVQANYEELLHGKFNRDSIANFLVLNKILTDQNIGNATLSNQEIDDLKRQEFIESVGLLIPSRFKASIQSISEQFPFFTDISFESVPSEFIDVNSKDWKWDEKQNLVPIIMPGMFLDFYNFQFSFSQNLPQLTQDVVKMIVFKINLTGPNGTRSFNGRVVGFSDRISSLLVPQEFMDYGNNHFSIGKELKPSRVIIRTRDPGNPKLVKFLSEKNLSTDSDKTRFSRYRQIVDMVVSVSWITGAIMLVFALLIFTLFIQLTFASCKEEIILLVTLGASPNQLLRFLMYQFFPVNFLIVFVSVISLSGLQLFMHRILSLQSITLSKYPSIYTILVACIILLLIWVVNRTTIKKMLYSPII